MTTASVPSRLPRAVQPISNCWRTHGARPAFCWVIAIALHALVAPPGVIAILFSFNDGRSRNTWQGFSTQWYWENPESVWNDPVLQHSLVQSLKLAAGDDADRHADRRPPGAGLTRWRGWGKRPSNLLMLLPLITPELVIATALFFVFTQLFHNFIELGTTAQLLGHVTFSLSYVVVIVRARLVSLGREYEEAAMDLGASPLLSLRLVVLPLLLPAIVASLMVVFAISIDDFITSQYLAAGPDIDHHADADLRQRPRRPAAVHQRTGRDHGRPSPCSA